jgi:hypothetical protein
VEVVEEVEGVITTITITTIITITIGINHSKETLLILNLMINQPMQ